MAASPRLYSNPILLPEDLPPKLKEDLESPRRDLLTRPSTLREVERRHVEWTLREAKGNRKLAAELLGINRRTLYRIAKRYGIGLDPGEE